MHAHVREPKFKATLQCEIAEQPPIAFLFEGETPREIMDQYQQLIGDANASVSVSKDMGVKKFGSGASAMVTVSLTCNQDQQTIARAIDLAAQTARYYAKAYQQQAEAELRSMLQQQGRPVEF
jgi:hypothetical protein